MSVLSNDALEESVPLSLWWLAAVMEQANLNLTVFICSANSVAAMIIIDLNLM